VPLSDQPKYISRHGYASQNVMAVCDFDMRFIFVVTGWPGSVHDTRVLLDTLLTCKDQFPHPSDGKNKLPKKKKMENIILLTLDTLIEKNFLHPTTDIGIMFLNGVMVTNQWD